jgi:Protein of unknown function (DUF3577).
MTTNTNTTKYFDLHTRGIGYVNRIREVKPKKGDSFWACTIGALRGSVEEAEYTYFDCRISGAEANKLIRRCEEAVNAEKKVMIGFTIGDIYPETFVFEKGKNQGQTGVSLKGRLLFVSFIKVDGEEVYKAAKPEEKAA